METHRLLPLLNLQLMELFYSQDIALGSRTLDRQESNHCIKVLRHRNGDTIHVIDGCGNLYECVIADDDPNTTVYDIKSVTEGYGSHNYHLHIAVAPPKNIDRFEWFCEKATETGVDEITPLVGDYSQRKVFKGDRCERIIVSAAKQSHKGAIPQLHGLTCVSDFIRQDFGPDTAKYICYCDDVEPLGGTKIHISQALRQAGTSNFAVMIGPEGDFSRSEISLALANGWQVISLGDSRLRIETAALVAVAAVYLAS